MKRFNIIMIGILLSTTVFLFAQPKELINKRTFCSKTYLEEDGSFSLHVSTDPMHYRNKCGQLTDISTHLSSSKSTGDYSVTQGLYRAYFKNNPAEENPVIFETTGGVSLGLGLMAMVYFDSSTLTYKNLEHINSVSGIPYENSMIYNNIFKNVNVKYYYDKTRLKEYIYFSQTARDKLPIPEDYGINRENAYLMFLSKLDMKGALPMFSSTHKRIESTDFTTRKRIYFKNLNNEIEFCMLPDYAWLQPTSEQTDSLRTDLHTIMLKRIFREKQNHYYMTGIPYQWLINLPKGDIIFDPQIEITFQPDGPVGKDAWITNYYNDRNAGAAARLQIEKNSSIWRSLIQFTEIESYIPEGAVIEEATLTMYAYYVNNSSGLPIDLHRVTNSWLEGTGASFSGETNSSSINGVTWLERWYGQNWNSNGGDYDATPVLEDTIAYDDTFLSFEIDSLVQGWVSREYENYGIMLLSDSTASIYARLSSAETANNYEELYDPLLKITYSVTKPLTTYYIRDATGQVIATYER